MTQQRLSLAFYPSSHFRASPPLAPHSDPGCPRLRSDHQERCQAQTGAAHAQERRSGQSPVTVWRFCRLRRFIFHRLRLLRCKRGGCRTVTVCQAVNARSHQLWVPISLGSRVKGNAKWYGLILIETLLMRIDSLPPHPCIQRATKSAMVRARQASLQVKSSKFERQLDAQKLEEENRRLQEKRKNMMGRCRLGRLFNRCSALPDQLDPQRRECSFCDRLCQREAQRRWAGSVWVGG